MEDVPLTGLGLADDHINLKQIAEDSAGRIYAAVKTSAGDSSTDPPDATLVGVFTRTPRADGSGDWTLAPAGTVGDDHTRPVIMIDKTNQELYFFATHSGDIVYKKTPLSQVNFAAGRGTPFVVVAPAVNNASGAKEPVTADSGMVILANAEGKKLYAHAELQLAGGSTEPPPPTDETPPTATTSPTSGGTGIAVTANVTATFSEPVQAVDGASFTLTTSAGAAVPATVSYAVSSRVGTLDPASDLAAGTQCTATLTGGADKIRDLADNALATTSWVFTTATGAVTGAPTVKTRTPAIGATGVGVAANVTATFSEAVQGVDVTTFTLVNSATRSQVGAVVSRNGTTNQWILNPSVNLVADTGYTAMLTGGSTAIRDTGGTPLTTTSWTFLTGPAPTVKTRSPAANATGVGPTTSVMATFSEAVQNVTATTFTLKPAAGGSALSATVSRDGTTNRWILDPGVTLMSSTKYTVTVLGRTGGVADLAGNALKTNVTWSFTTGG